MAGATQPQGPGGISALLNDEKFSDMIIRCGGREFKAHRAIVCTQSSFFDKALTLKFKEGISKIVDLPDDDPDMLELFLEFLYRGSYTDRYYTLIPQKRRASTGLTAEAVFKRLKRCSSLARNTPNSLPNAQEQSTPRPMKRTLQTRAFQMASLSREEEKADGDEQRTSTEACLRQALQLYTMADVYDVPALRLATSHRFYEVADRFWDDYIDDYLPGLMDEMYECTATTDKGIRKVACRLVGNRIVKSDTTREAMQWVMEKHGHFAVGVMEYVIEAYWGKVNGSAEARFGT